jgi:hypothetical protein
MSGFLRVLTFFQGLNQKTGKPQLRCYLGNKEKGTLFVVDTTSPILPEIDKWFVCEESRELSVSPDGKKNTMTVLVHGEVVIDSDHGVFHPRLHKDVTRWECHGKINITPDWAMRVILVADNKGVKNPLLPNRPGDSWFFKVKHPLTVGGDYIVMLVELTKQNISDRALRRRNGEKGDHTSQAA